MLRADQAALYGQVNDIKDLGLPFLWIQVVGPNTRKERRMENVPKIISLVLKAVALGMGVTSIILGILGAANVGTQVTLLSIGLFALALEALQNE